MYFVMTLHKVTTCI